MKKHDFIVIGIILAAAAVLFAALHFIPQNGAYVRIETDKKVVETLPLNEDTEYEIKTENGTNTLVIKDGFAYVSEADCKNQICVHHRKISKSGESIICLPHKVVITVVDKNADSEIDAGV
ncbi:MAG: NusG domain II-containing protein [Eubacterium sp.]|nr:NusG domain II-containing protein [Eubacterium sp.]